MRLLAAGSRRHCGLDNCEAAAKPVNLMILAFVPVDCLLGLSRIEQGILAMGIGDKTWIFFAVCSIYTAKRDLVRCKTLEFYGNEFQDPRNNFSSYY